MENTPNAVSPAASAAGLSDAFRERLEREILISLAGPAAGHLVRHKGSRYRTAIHEAAHVVAGRVLGRLAFKVSIVPALHTNGTKSLGITAFSENGAREVGGTAPLSPVPTDRRLTIILISWISPADQWNWQYGRREFRRYRGQAESLVHQHWAAIEALAVELVWERTLGPEAIEAVLQRTA
jgi:hypothetical protein